MKVREPVARPIDVVGVELSFSASQAFLVGVLVYLAMGTWDDRGLGHGPVAVIVALLGLAVGAAWAYWLMGGVGWPLAAANVPVSMFLGFVLVLGWTGSDLFVVTGVPLVLASLASLLGIAGGVFIESPRRWRWDQRQRLRPGTRVPHVSSTTRRVVAAVPRSIPRREPPPPPTSELAARIGKSPSPSPGPGPGAGTRIPYVDVAAVPVVPIPSEPFKVDGPAVMAGQRAAATDALEEAAVVPAMPTQRLLGIPVATVPDRHHGADDGETGGIVLPTALEPRAQRSPWAWAAPPEWNRDEDDEGSTGRPSDRT